MANAAVNPNERLSLATSLAYSYNNVELVLLFQNFAVKPALADLL